MKVDRSISEAAEMWVAHGINPGSCTELLLRGDYEEAFMHAHLLIKPFWDDHIKYIESLPPQCRGENYDNWKGMQNFWEAGNGKD
jgi:hypothetical protein